MPSHLIRKQSEICWQVHQSSRQGGQDGGKGEKSASCCCGCCWTQLCCWLAWNWIGSGYLWPGRMQSMPAIAEQQQQLLHLHKFLLALPGELGEQQLNMNFTFYFRLNITKCLCEATTNRKITVTVPNHNNNRWSSSSGSWSDRGLIKRMGYIFLILSERRQAFNIVQLLLLLLPAACQAPATYISRMSGKTKLNAHYAIDSTHRCPVSPSLPLSIFLFFSLCLLTCILGSCWL